MKKGLCLAAVMIITGCLFSGCFFTARTYNENGLKLYEEGKYEEACEELEKAVEESPRSAGFYTNLGMACLAAGKEEQAENAFDTAISLNSSEAYAYRGRGILEMQQQKYQAAIQDFAQAEAVSEDKELIRDVRMYLAEAAVQAGSYEEAENALQKMLTDEPEDYETMYQLAKTYLMAGQAEAAVSELTAMSQVSSVKPAYLLYAYQLLASYNQSDAGKTFLTLLLERTDSDEEAVICRGEAACILENYERTISELTSVNSLDDTARTYLASSYLAVGDKEKALQIYLDLEQKDPSNPDTDLQIALVYIASQDYVTALDYIHQGQGKSQSGQCERLDYYEALCYEYTEEYAKALELFETYVDHYGTTDSVNHEIEFLKTR